MKEAKVTGKVIQVIGPVVDVEFENNLPAIYTALTIEREKQDTYTWRLNNNYLIQKFDVSL